LLLLYSAVYYIIIIFYPRQSLFSAHTHTTHNIVYEYHTLWTIFVLFRSQTIGCHKKTKPLATVRKMLRYYHITSNQPVKQHLLVTVHWLLLDCVDTALPLVGPRSCRIASQSLVLKKLNLTQQKQTVIWNTKIPQHTTNKKSHVWPPRITFSLKTDQALFSGWRWYEVTKCGFRFLLCVVVFCVPG